MAKTSESMLRAIAKYKETKEEIRVSVDRGRKAEWKEHAAEQGESLNGFVNRAMEETRQRDKQRNA